VFELSVETEFAAAHAIVLNGQREPLHGHNWRVTATLSGPTLDAQGLLCDFHIVESGLRDITGPWHNRNLNDLPPFADGLNPSAEHIARHIAGELARALVGRVPPGVKLTAVRITEAPGCAAIYRP
jgi:6-pyruvoyltetrahydropterin/6-carboxytetrahydropterin synthase